jgi:hypothetical protein
MSGNSLWRVYYESDAWTSIDFVIWWDKRSIEQKEFDANAHEVRTMINIHVLHLFGLDHDPFVYSAQDDDTDDRMVSR